MKSNGKVIFRDRLIRLGMMGFMWDLSYLVALPVGAWLFNSGSYICVLSTALLLYVVACVLGVIRLWGFQENINKTDMTWKGIKVH